MSLYFVYTPNIKERRSDYVFYFEKGQCFLIQGNKNSHAVFDVLGKGIEDYKKIVRFSEHKKINEFEILFKSPDCIKRLLKYFSNYLLTKDLSIGLLTEDSNVIEQNRVLLESYGVTTPNPLFNTISYKQAEPRTDYKAKPIIDEFESYGLPDSGLVLPCFCIADSPKKSKRTRHEISATIELDESFHDKFIKLLIESGKDNVEVYKKAGVSRQVFSKIISDKNMIPTKLTLISLCIGLELSLKEARELMVSAGYSLSKSIMLDAIVMKYIREEIFDFDLINSELNEYGCQLLGWHPREN